MYLLGGWGGTKQWHEYLRYCQNPALRPSIKTNKSHLPFSDFLKFGTLSNLLWGLPRKHVISLLKENTPFFWRCGVLPRTVSITSPVKRKMLPRIHRGVRYDFMSPLCGSTKYMELPSPHLTCRRTGADAGRSCPFLQWLERCFCWSDITPLT